MLGKVCEFSGGKPKTSQEIEHKREEVKMSIFRIDELAALIKFKCTKDVNASSVLPSNASGIYSSSK
jgi:hypothetical protein